MTKTVLSLVALGLFAVASLAIADESENVIRNGDFENLEENWEVPNPDTGTITYEKTGGEVGPSFARMGPTNSASPKLFYLQQYADNTKPGEYVAKVRFRLGEEYAAKMPTFYVNVMKPEGGPPEVYRLTLPNSAEIGKWVVLENDVNVPAGTKRIYFQVTVLGAMGHVDVDGVELSPKPAAATTQPASDGKRQATSAHRVAAGRTDIFVPHHRAIPVFLFNRVVP